MPKEYTTPELRRLKSGRNRRWPRWRPASAPDCPACKETETLYELAANKWRCASCGNSFTFTRTL